MIRKTLGDILVDRGFATHQQIDAALAYQTAAGKPIGEIMLQLGFVNERQLTDALAEQQHVETWDLRACPPDPEAVAKVSARFCVDNLLIPVQIADETLTVAMRNPGDLSAIDRLCSTTRMRISPVQAADTALASILNRLFGSDPSLRESIDTFVSRALADLDGGGREVNEAETRPVIGIVDQMVSDAIAMRASDLHLEPREDHAEVRYRIDGQLKTIRFIPGSLVRMVVARIKIMADLDITNRRHPQDGRIEFRRDGISTDLRVSILPTQFGSRVVMRVLDRSVAIKRLDELGFNPRNATVFRHMIRNPYGIILVTGPTGSGKTTTLYAAVNEIKNDFTNFMTCEDPIEYTLDRVNQSQVDEKSGLTFASQLRAILRQDPDAILVGEIRDAETAETAMRAAMTGHLVLSTLHCNDAPGALPRLVNMGLDPYTLSTTISGVVAQRLVRALCPCCREAHEPTEDERRTLLAFGIESLEKIWRPTGCDDCADTGYAGRFAVHEVLPVTEEISALIAKEAPNEEIRRTARPYGFRTMAHDAAWRVARGVTSLEEARRLVAIDSYQVFAEDEPADELRLAS